MPGEAVEFFFSNAIPSIHAIVTNYLVPVPLSWPYQLNSMPSIRTIMGRRGSSTAESRWDQSSLGFTILELMTVIAIIAIATAVAVPAIGSLNKGSARRAAVSLTLGVFDQTRALALSRNGNFYLAFADDNSDWPEDHRYRALAIFEETFSPNGTSGTQYHCVPVTNWSKLPVGVAFDPAIGTVFKGLTKKTFYFPPLGKEISAAFFKFNSVGAVDEPTDSALASVKIFEGFISSNGLPTYTNQGATEEVIKVSLATGRAKREEP